MHEIISPVVVLVHRSPEIRRIVRRALDGRVALYEAASLKVADALLRDHPETRVLAIGSVRPSGHLDPDPELQRFIEERARRITIVGSSGTQIIREWMLVWGCAVVCDHAQWHNRVITEAFAPRSIPSPV